MTNDEAIDLISTELSLQFERVRCLTFEIKDMEWEREDKAIGRYLHYTMKAGSPLECVEKARRMSLEEREAHLVLYSLERASPKG